MDIFIGSLPFKMTEDQIRELFEKFGKVSSVRIVKDKITRQNKGFGFVEMPDDKEALNAIKSLNKTEVMDRKLIVSKSEEKKEGTKRRGGKEGERAGKEGGEAVNVPWRKKFHPKKRIVSFGEQGDDNKKKKVKSARNHKHPWQKK
jgi:RNA recognition motif-containing protein